MSLSSTPPPPASQATPPDCVGVNVILDVVNVWLYDGPVIDQV